VLRNVLRSKCRGECDEEQVLRRRCCGEGIEECVEEKVLRRKC